MGNAEMIPRHLGTILKRYIAARGLSVREAANFFGTSPSKLDRYLKGENQKVEPGLINGWLNMLGAPSEVIRDAEAMALQTRGRKSTGWASSAPIWFGPFIDLERRATAIDSFSQSFIPGLLQTRECMEAVSNSSAVLDAEGTAMAIDVRTARQKILESNDCPTLRFILTEQCLRLIRPYDFYDGQMLHLLQLNELEQVSIFVIPDHHGLHASMGGPYVIMTFDDTPDPDTVYIEFQGGAHYDSSESILDRHRKAWSATLGVADSIERSEWMSKWRKATRSNPQADCVEWRRSTRSVEEGECVELRKEAGDFLVRDSKLGESSPVFGIGSDSFAAMLDNLKRRLATEG